MPRKPKPSPAKPRTKANAEGIAPTAVVTEETVSTVEQPKKPWLFQKGNNANPSGRPKGSRNKLEEAFVASLCEAFEEGGAQAIKTVMTKDPVAFLNVIAKVLPKQVETSIKVSIEELDDDELANIAAGGRARVAAATEDQAKLH